MHPAPHPQRACPVGHVTRSDTAMGRADLVEAIDNIDACGGLLSDRATVRRAELAALLHRHAAA